jgi:quinol monooxygenase YgiN
MSAVVIVTSRLKSPEHRDRFISLSRETETWMQAQPGFLRYELFEGVGAWTDTMLWDSPAAAEAGNRAFADTPLAAAFAEVVESDYRGFEGRLFHLQEPAQ